MNFQDIKEIICEEMVETFLPFLSKDKKVRNACIALQILSIVLTAGNFYRELSKPAPRQTNCYIVVNEDGIVKAVCKK
jgi:hypothetical protein